MKDYDYIYELYKEGRITQRECGYMMKRELDKRITLNSYYKTHINSTLAIIDNKNKTCMIILNNYQYASDGGIDTEDVHKHFQRYRAGERGVIEV